MAGGRGDRFDYCKFVELDYVPMETGCMVSMRPTKGHGPRASSKGLSSSRSPDQRSHSGSSTPRSRRAVAASRDACGNASVSSSTSSSCRGSDCSPTKRQQQRFTTCTDNHGIRPPPPEQYLTPLQQKEVCIRHLRARLKDTVSTLQDRDSEIDDLRSQLYRMQEEWVEEECHRVEAQLALKEARLEIQQLKLAVESVCTRLSDAEDVDTDVQNYFKDINAQNHKLENFLVHMELAQARLARDRETGPRSRTHAGGSAPASVSGESPGGLPRASIAGTLSCSCGNSPARSLTRSSTYTKLSEQTLAERPGHAHSHSAQDSGFVCSGEIVPSRAELLLEAAFLSEETASLLSSYTQTLSHSLSSSMSSSLTQSCSQSFLPALPHTHRFPSSCTYESVHCPLAGTGCPTQPHLSHHHLCVHPLRETGIQTEGSGVCCYDLDTIAEQRTFRSQACSPTSTWVSDEGEEELDSITVTTATILSASCTVPSLACSTQACTVGSPLGGANEGTEGGTEEETGGRWKECLDEETTMTSAGENEGRLWAVSERSEEINRLPFEKSANEEKQVETREGGELREEEPGVSAGWSQAAELNPGASPEQAHTSQPRSSASPEAIVTVVQESSEEDGDQQQSSAAAPGCDKIQRSYWSRHFWVDLLAVVVPMVPTMAWLCHGPARGAQPIYHFGSLLRGCCTVALHSLRRGGGLRHYPAGGGDPGGSVI